MKNGKLITKLFRLLIFGVSADIFYKILKFMHKCGANEILLNVLAGIYLFLLIIVGTLLYCRRLNRFMKVLYTVYLTDPDAVFDGGLV